jgi:hypothetical protein
VELQSFTSPLSQSATLEFRTPSTQTVVYSTPITLDASGNYVAQGVPLGAYDVACKFPHWLRQVLPGVTIGPSGATANFSVTNGDANGDNHIGSLDLAVVLLDFMGNDAAADLDGDGTVGILDLAIVLMNFRMVGDP